MTPHTKKLIGTILMLIWLIIYALVVSALLLVFGQWVFRRLEGKFAQEL